MCVICVKPAGISLPTDEYLNNMWNNNRDGAGLMYAKNGEVIIEKGFMRLADFMAAIDRLKAEEDTVAMPIVLHFRIGTHGGNIAANTHPFPITENFDIMRKPYGRYPIGVAHNGIIHIAPRTTNISDTMEFIVSMLAPLYQAIPDFYENQTLCRMVENMAQSKLAFLAGDGHFTLIGKFIQDKDGCFYSNDSYSRTAWNPPKLGWNTPYWNSWSYPVDDERLSIFGEDESETITKTLMVLPDEAYIVSYDTGARYESEDYFFAIDCYGDLYYIDENFMAYPVFDSVGIFQANGANVVFDKEEAFECVCVDNMIDMECLEAC